MAVGSQNWYPTGASAIDVDAATLGTVFLPYAYDLLMVQYNIVGYSVADTAGFIFNDDIPLPPFFVGMYGDRHLHVAVGVTTLTNSQALDAAIVRVSGLTTVQAQTGVAYISAKYNAFAGQSMTILNTTASGSVSVAAPVSLLGNGTYNSGINNAGGADITQIEMKTSGGNNMLAGSGFAVFGFNAI